MHLNDLPTPALLLDLDILERNLADMSEKARMFFGRSNSIRNSISMGCSCRAFSSWLIMDVCWLARDEQPSRADSLHNFKIDKETDNGSCKRQW